MATYQFKIELLPRAWAQNNNYDAKGLYDTEQHNDFELYDPSIAWKNITLSVELDPIISKILPKSKSWDSNLLVWGDDERNDIKAWMHNEQELESIAIRLDLRDNIDKLINDIVGFAERIDCVLFIPETKQIIEPSLFAIYEVIKNSSATRYIKNPHNYLEEITKKGEGKK